MDPEANFKSTARFIRDNKPKTYYTKTISLAEARTDKELLFDGDNIIVDSIDGEAYIKLNEKAHDNIDLRTHRTLKGTFIRLYLTNTAQAGKSVTLMIGRAEQFYAPATPASKIQDSTGVDINPATKDQFLPATLLSLMTQAVTAATAILGAGNEVSPSTSPATLRVYAAFDTAGVLSAVISNGGDSAEVKFNAGEDLIANSLYAFDLPMLSGDEVDFKFSATGNLLVLRANEIVSGVA